MPTPLPECIDCDGENVDECEQSGIATFECSDCQAEWYHMGKHTYVRYEGIMPQFVFENA